MSRIKDGPPQGAPILPPAPDEQPTPTNRLASGQTQVPAALRNAEHQAQETLADMLANQKKKMSAADTERLVSQAGYQRSSGKKRHKGLDIGDSTQAPIPLPGDDTDAAEWSQAALQDAQEEFTEQGAAFFEAAKTLPQGASLEALWQRVISERYADNPEALGQMARNAQAPPAEPVVASLGLAAMQSSAAAYFGKSLGQADPGHAVVAAALLVAGRADAVDMVPGTAGQKDALEPQKLAAGVQHVVRGGHMAVEDARSMNEGIDKKLSMHRTFVFKR